MGMLHGVLSHAVRKAKRGRASGGLRGTKGTAVPPAVWMTRLVAQDNDHTLMHNRLSLVLQALLAIAAVTVPTAARLFLLQPLLFRRLQVRHILAVLPQHTAPVDLTAKPFQSAIDRLVVAYFYTYSQSRSLVIPV